MSRILRLFVGSGIASLLAFTHTSIADAARVDVALSANVQANGKVLTFKISPDGNWVVYQVSGPTAEIFSVPIRGGNETRLNSQIIEGGKVQSFEISPDSTHVVYRADAQTVGVMELFSVPIEGGDAVRLSGSAPPVALPKFLITHDGLHVLYNARVGTAPLKLFRNSIAGGVPTPFTESESRRVDDFALTPDGQTILLQLNSGGTFGVRSHARLPVDGGEVTDLYAGDGLEDWRFSSFSWTMSPDSNWLVFEDFLINLAELRPPFVYSQGARVSPLFYPAFTHDSQHILYDVAGNLLSKPVSGGGEVRLNAPLEQGAQVVAHFLSDDSTELVYIADTPDDTLEAYRIPVTGGERLPLDSTQLSRASGFETEQTYIHAPVIGLLLPDQRREIVYLPSDGAPSYRIDASCLDGLNARSFVMSPDRSYIVYSRENGGLHRVPVKGGSIELVSVEWPDGTTLSPVVKFATGNEIVYIDMTAEDTLRVNYQDSTCEGVQEKGTAEDAWHSADSNASAGIDLPELMRIIQLYNGLRIACDNGGDSADGYAICTGCGQCAAHDSDYNPQDWSISLSEVLRAVQLYQAGGYVACEQGEDGYCPAL